MQSHRYDDRTTDDDHSVKITLYIGSRNLIDSTEPNQFPLPIMLAFSNIYIYI